MLNCILGFLVGLIGVGLYHFFVVAGFEAVFGELQEHLDILQTRTQRMVVVMEQLMASGDLEGMSGQFTEALNDLAAEFRAMTEIIIKHSIPGA